MRVTRIPSEYARSFKAAAAYFIKNECSDIPNPTDDQVSSVIDDIKSNNTCGNDQVKSCDDRVFITRIQQWISGTVELAGLKCPEADNQAVVEVPNPDAAVPPNPVPAPIPDAGVAPVPNPIPNPTPIPDAAVEALKNPDAAKPKPKVKKPVIKKRPVVRKKKDAGVKAPVKKTPAPKLPDAGGLI